MEMLHLRDVTMEDEVGDRATQKDYQQLAKEQQQVTHTVQNLEKNSLVWISHGVLVISPLHGEGSLQPGGRPLWQRNRNLCSVN